MFKYCWDEANREGKKTEDAKIEGMRYRTQKQRLS